MYYNTPTWNFCSSISFCVSDNNTSECRYGNRNNLPHNL